MSVENTSDVTKEIQFEIGLVWDGGLYWYTKEAGAARFTYCLASVGDGNGNIQMDFEGDIKHQEICYAPKWED